MELGDDALALELLELTEADFALENTEFAELIRADIGARRPDLVNRLRAGNVLGAAAARQDDGRGLLSLGQDLSPRLPRISIPSRSSTSLDSAFFQAARNATSLILRKSWKTLVNR